MADAAPRTTWKLVMTLPSLLTINPLPWESAVPDASKVTITTLALVAASEIAVMSEGGRGLCAQGSERGKGKRKD